MYVTVIDEKEKYLGYALSHVPNLSGKIKGEPEYIRAVAYRLNDENLIVKRLNPIGGYRYWHIKKTGGAWLTVNNTEPDPGTAIEKALKDD